MKVTGDQPLQVGQHSSSALPAETGAEFCGITSFLLRGRGRDHFVTLAVVASGLGTDAQAHRSSQLAGMVLRRHFSQSDSADMLELLSDALEQANRLIYERRFGFLRAGGTPGATLAAAVVFDTKLYAVSVGDCRVFLQRQNGPLIQITPIRSADVGRRAGTVSITDSPFPETFLGRAPTLSLDLRLNLSQGGSDRDMIGNQGAELEPGDTLLLLTRGIPQTLSLDRIESTLKRFPPDRAAERLADAAVSGQGAPSASALVLRVPGGSTPTGVWWRRPAVGRGLMVILALLAVSGTLYATRGSLPFFTSAAPTNTLTATATATPTPVPSATPAASRTPSPIPTVSATNTVTPSPTETVTASPTATASHTPTPTQSPTATSTPTLTPTPTPTHPRWRTLTPSTTPSSTWTATVTLAPPPPPPPPPPPTSTSAPPLTNTPVPTPTDTPVPPPTDTPIPTPTYTREIPIPEN